MDLFVKNFNNIGPLYMDEILVYYDCPQIFSLVDACKSSYLCMLVNMNESFEYLMINVSKERLSDIKSSTISLYEAYKNCELDVLYKVKELEYGYEFKVIDKKQIELSDLPDEDLYLNMLIDSSLLIPESEKLWNSVRDSLDLRIVDNKNPQKHEIDCSVFSKLLNGIQNIFNSIAQNKYKTTHSKKEINDMSKLSFSGMYRGSVGIKLKSASTQDLLCQTGLTPILEKFAELVNLSSSEELKEFFEYNNYNYKVITDYKNHLSSLIKNDFDIEYKILTKTTNFNKYVANRNIIEKYDNLNKYISNRSFVEKYEGVLVAADIKSKTFKLDIGEKVISGIIPTSLLEFKFNVNEKVVMEVEITQEKDELGNNIIEKFKLLNIF